MKFLIYMLHHEMSKHVYVGRSSDGLRRPRQHAKPSVLKKYAHLPIARWIKKLPTHYTITILEKHTTEETLNEAERFFIAYFKSIGLPLLNCTDGGEGTIGFRFSAEARMRSSLARKGVPKTAEHRSKIGLAQRGKIVSEETKKKISRTSKGRTHSEATRKQMSAAHTGKTLSEEHRKAVSKAKRGCKRKPFSVEHRRRLSEAHRGKAKSEQHKAKISAALREYYQP